MSRATRRSCVPGKTERPRHRYRALCTALLAALFFSPTPAVANEAGPLGSIVPAEQVQIDMEAYRREGLSSYVASFGESTVIDLFGAQGGHVARVEADVAAFSPEHDWGSCLDDCRICGETGSVFHCMACAGCRVEEPEDECDPDVDPDGCECPQAALGLDCDEADLEGTF